jgi:hypothetical protein
MGLASVARGHGGFQFERPERRDLRQRLQCTGFVIPSEVPNEEIVISVAGRCWRPDGGRCMELAARDFAPFSRSGFAKVARNFKRRADSPLSSVLSTEMRIQCFAQAALWKFRLYWSLVGPFSGFMRKAILKQVKTVTESRVESNPPKVWTKEWKQIKEPFAIRNPTHGDCAAILETNSARPDAS